MTSPAIRAFTVAAVFVAFVTGSSETNAQRGHPFDGNWSVTIQATSGDCSTNSLYGVVIVGGSVRYAGGAGVQMSGHVSHNGAVSVSVANGPQRASGSGRLRGNSGGGRWSGSGPTGRCAGARSAQRGG